AAERVAAKTGRTGQEIAALDELARLLGLEKPPAVIEAYDISHTAGQEAVGGMVVFENGAPKRACYRRFKIRSFEGNDDCRAMAEVLYRRFKEYREQQSLPEERRDTAFARLPDLILLDGGQGQLSAVLPVMQEFELAAPLFGMVKDDKHRTRAIAVAGGEIAVKSTRAAFSLVTSIQDEVHRFSVDYHRKLRSKKQFSSTLTQISGIGPARAKVLLKHFGTVEAIKKAEVEDLAAVKGLTKTAARAIFEYFRRES
ncbi:MAG: excinuclease ABC subunit UvrC, partial [Oscillospiraceae bacterium]|nr:excinuclease ABC subunit UvrC [Oscillospiraceae bacterium]